MSVKIRLKRMGKKKKPFYRFVAADSRRARDGRFIEMLGYYDPMTEPENINIDYDKVYNWLDKGAQCSENVSSLFKRIGVFEKWRLLKEGVKITELDSVIEERRKKQPSKKPKTEKMEKTEEKPAEEKVEEEAKIEESPEAEKTEEPAPEGKKQEKDEKDEKDEKEEKEEKEDGKKKVEEKESADEKTDSSEESDKPSEEEMKED